jgi:hypothetical protein
LVLLPRLQSARALLSAAIDSRRIGSRVELTVAEVGAWSTAMLALWGLYTLGHWPTNVPVLQTYRLGFYWNDQRDRWLLLLLPGACGLIAMLRLARRGQVVPLVWFGTLLVLGSVGAVVHLATGYQLPLYYRLILMCQVPLAVAVGSFLAEHRSRRAAAIVLATLAGALAFKAVTLLTVPDNLSYFGARLSTLWQFGRVIPPRTGVVASDPNTSYFIPVATRDRVLTVGKGHADSGTEPQQASTGYTLMHELYAGGQRQAAAALRRMWHRGVRWVVVEAYTTLSPPTQQALFSAPYNGLITGRDITTLARYDARLLAVGRQTFQNGEYTVFRLGRQRLLSATDAAPAFSARQRHGIERALRTLASGDLRTARPESKALYRLGVRSVALSYGDLGSTPALLAFGRSLSNGEVVLPVTSGRWVVGCLPQCYTAPSSSEIERLGRLLHTDGRFATIVALASPRRHS